jgi:hypothetical protein
VRSKYYRYIGHDGKGMTPEQALKSVQMNKGDVINFKETVCAKQVAVDEFGYDQRKRTFDNRAAIFMQAGVGLLADQEKIEFTAGVGENIRNCASLAAQMGFEYNKGDIFYAHRRPVFSFMKHATTCYI